MKTGILLTNKTYGRDKKGRLLYLCIADTSAHRIADTSAHRIADTSAHRIADTSATDTSTTSSSSNYLIPFNNPSLTQFNKASINYYIVFTCTSGTAGATPTGQLMDCLGQVNDWAVYSKYELFKRNLYRTGFQNLDKQVNLLNSIQGIPETHPIISIDPPGCTDIDDAFAFFINNNRAFLQIHIANVPIFMESYNLWNLLTDRATTVYMPTGKVPMLPKHLSENTCSLLEGTIKPTFMIEFMFEFDATLNKITHLLGHREPKAVFAKIEKNYSYNDNNIPNKDLLFEAAKFMEPEQKIADTHDLIAVFMMAFNKACAPFVPIYRNCIECVPVEGAAFYNDLQAFSASYDTQCKEHASFGTAYTHITSPIRRMADLVNMTALLYGTAHPFVQTWIKNIEHMNNYCKQARKAQQNAELYKLLSSTLDEELIYDGIYVKDADAVYLPDIRLFVNVGKGQHDLKEGKRKYKIYMFHREFTLKRKIRIMPVVKTI